MGRRDMATTTTATRTRGAMAITKATAIWGISDIAALEDQEDTTGATMDAIMTAIADKTGKIPAHPGINMDAKAIGEIATGEMKIGTRATGIMEDPEEKIGDAEI